MSVYADFKICASWQKILDGSKILTMYFFSERHGTKITWSTLVIINMLSLFKFNDIVFGCKRNDLACANEDRTAYDLCCDGVKRYYKNCCSADCLTDECKMEEVHCIWTEDSIECDDNADRRNGLNERHLSIRLRLIVHTCLSALHWCSFHFHISGRRDYGR